MNSSPPRALPLRIGAVTYLNSKPLVECLPEVFPHAVIRDDYPSRLADDLAEGKLDVALIPSIEYFRRDGYEIVSDACIAARGPVLSVKLYSRIPWGEVRTLGLDEGSRTSAALAKILLGERFGVKPQCVPFRLEEEIESCPADAVLMIGDRAMRPPRETFHATWDLGEEWFRWTGLPFVFAMWVARPPSEREAFAPRREVADQVAPAPGPCGPRSEDHFANIARRLSHARDLGVQSINAIARREASLLNLSLATTIQYLTKNLHFHLGPAEQNGLRLFLELAVRRGLAPEDSKLVFRTCARSG
jgi:chorismate dehydratase